LVAAISGIGLRRQPQTADERLVASAGDGFVYLGVDQLVSDGSRWLLVAVMPDAWPVLWINAHYVSLKYAENAGLYTCP
jgi:hypothetical protein